MALVDIRFTPKSGHQAFTSTHPDAAHARFEAPATALHHGLRKISGSLASSGAMASAAATAGTLFEDLFNANGRDLFDNWMKLCDYGGRIRKKQVVWMGTVRHMIGITDAKLADLCWRHGSISRISR